MASVPHRALRTTVATDSSAHPLPRVRRRRWGRLALVLTLSFLLLAALFPTIASHTPLGTWAINLALGGTVTVKAQKLSVGWFSAFSLQELELHDRREELLLKAASVTGDKSLWGLLTNRSQLGSIQIKQPLLHVELRADGSNVEDIAAAWQRKSDASSASPTVALEIEDGGITVVDSTIGRQWHVEGVAAKVATSNDPAVPPAINMTGTIPVGMETCHIAADLKMPTTGESTGQGKFTATNFPLLMVQALLARFAPGNKLRGTLTTELQCNWKAGAEAPELSMEGTTTIDDLQLASPLLRNDVLAIQRVQLPCKVALAGDRLTIHDAGIISDIGQLQGVGTVRLPSADDKDFLNNLAHESFTIEGKLDLVRLAALLPNALRIRENTEITSGTAKAELRSGSGKGIHRWEGRLELSPLAATSNGQRIVWEQPLTVSLAAHDGPQGLLVDQLVCRSNFIEVSASGSQKQLEGQAKFDLDQLADHLGQFVDLSTWQISGNGEARCAWTLAADQRFQTSANLMLRNFRLATTNAPEWREPNLQLQAIAAGQLDGTHLRALQTADLQMVAGTDRMQTSLLEAIDNVQPNGKWPIGFHLEGKLANWLPRLRPWLATGDLALTGNCRCDAKGWYSTGETDIEQFQLDAEQFELRGHGLTMAEPTFHLEGNGKWNASTAYLKVAQVKLDCETLHLDASKIAAEFPAGEAPRLAGEMTFSGSIERLHQWLQTPAPGGVLLLGDFDGRGTIKWDGAQTGGTLNLKARDLALADLQLNAQGRLKPEVFWREPKIGVAASANYDPASDRLSVPEANVISQMLNVKATGKIDELRKSRQLDLSGTIDYDLAQLAPLVRPYLGKTVTAEGRESTLFKLRGPLADAGDSAGHWARRLTGEAGIAWQRIGVQGLLIEKGSIESRLADGSLRVSPFDVGISEGRLTSAPAVRIDPTPMELQLPAGPLLSHVRISPEMCDQALKYVAPVLAEATRTEGHISLNLEGGRVPLATPKQSDVAGTLAVHQVEVMPGPLAKDLILLGKQIEALLNRRPLLVSLPADQSALLHVRDQNVPFRVVEGRVHHQRLELVAGNVTIVTQGSVGLDQSLSIMAEVPVSEKWLGTDPALQSFKGQTLRIPIGGSLGKPKIDGRVMEQLTAQLVRGAAGRVISQELDKQLNRLFQGDK